MISKDESTPTPGVCRRGSGFTLIELLLVVMILGILSSIVLPRFGESTSDATAGLLQTNVLAIQSRVDVQAARDNENPAVIDPVWFSTKRLPDHPENTFNAPSVQLLPHATLSHPMAKVLKAGVPGAYWYNPTLGVVRVRVADQGSSAATIDFYNRVNQSTEVGLGNYGGGGGGGS